VWGAVGGVLGWGAVAPAFGQGAGAGRAGSEWTVTNFSLAPVAGPRAAPARGIDLSNSLAQIGPGEHITVLAPHRVTPPPSSERAPPAWLLLHKPEPGDGLFVPTGYCNSALSTVGGQPATGGDLLGGHC
jgi:hypothetical protein